MLNTAKRLYNEFFNYVNKCFCTEYREYLFSEFSINIVKKDENKARICLVPRHLEHVVKDFFNQVNVLTFGIIIGWVRGKNKSKFIPSTHLFNLAKDQGYSYGCAVVAKPQGVKAFLYGNDLLVTSVERFLEPIEKNLYVAVIDSEDMRAIGIGKLVIDPKDLNKLIAEGRILELVVKNEFDLGVLLRDEGYI